MVVSNHGGRQLDGAPSTISVLAEVVAAIDGRCEVLFDGGIRSGQDIAKALALGARAGLIGKSFLFALAAGGEAGVTRALEHHARRTARDHGADRHPECGVGGTAHAEVAPAAQPNLTAP